MKFQPTSKIDGKCIVVTLVDGSKKQEISMKIYTATGPLFGNKCGKPHKRQPRRLSMRSWPKRRMPGSSGSG